jgi:hypothetical protein
MKLPLLVMLLGALSPPLAAWGSLGGDTASVKTDQQAMNAVATATSAPAYTAYDIHTPSGIRIREFVSPSGLVFAVAWQGPALPDMRQLLGAYFDRYVNGVNALGPASSSRVVQQPGFVAYAGGHMRAFVGRAYIPEAVPEGVDVADIR